jgi:PAP_fibrillin
MHVFKSFMLQNKPVSSSSSAIEKQLVEAIAGVGGRGSSGSDDAKRKVNDLIAQLEASSGGVRDAACAASVDGIWRLIYTSTPGTASPIQRSFVGVDSFGIYQNIELYDLEKPATVTNVVDFGPSIGRLDVKALASTPQRPLAGFTPRRGDGKIFGLNIFGVSQTAEQSTAANPKARIDFQFDVAEFDLKLLPFNIPYPVPFRLLGDEVSSALSFNSKTNMRRRDQCVLVTTAKSVCFRVASKADPTFPSLAHQLMACCSFMQVKGWIDITYLSKSPAAGAVRIARGNKGTVFILVRE